jgi:hypothetical protein
MAGWICLYRDIQSHWVFNNAEHFRAWVDLLLLANHEKKTFELKGQLVIIDRGQVGLSQVSLAERWKWGHRDRVKRYLTLLEKDGMIELKTTHLNSVITICNYSHYQDEHASDEAPDKAASEAAGKAQTTIKQLNKETKKQVLNKQPDLQSILAGHGITGQLALDFHRLRKEKKAPITETAMAGIAKQAAKAGISMEAAIKICIERNWQGFNAGWDWQDKSATQKQETTRKII